MILVRVLGGARAFLLAARPQYQAVSTPKRHHFLPVCYLNGFSGDDGKVCLFDRESGDYRAQFPVACGYEKYLYSLVLPDGTKDAHLEAKFCAIESEFPKVRDCLESGNIPSGDELGALLAFVALQLFRVPATLRDIHELGSLALSKHLDSAMSDEDSADEFFAELFGPNSPEAAMPLDDKKALVKEMDCAYPRRNAALRMMFESMGQAYKLLSQKSVVTVFHAPQGRAFITSDRPVLIRKPSRNLLGLGGLLGPGSIATLPVSSQVAVSVSDGSRVAIRHSELSRDKVAQLNYGEARTSYRLLAGNSEQRLRTVVEKGKILGQPRLRSISPGKQPDEKNAS